MVIWKNVIKGVAKVSLPVIVLPAVFVVIIIGYFGFTLESLVAILLLGELYIIWAQLEVALRQTCLSTLEYEPEFKIEVKRDTDIAIEGRTSSAVGLELVNVGEHLARNVSVSVEVEGKQEEYGYRFFTNIAPSERVPFHALSERWFSTDTLTVDLDYDNVLGDSREMTFRKEHDIPEFIAIGRIRMPGLLLSSLEELGLIFGSVMLSRRVKKLKEEHKE